MFADVNIGSSICHQQKPSSALGGENQNRTSGVRIRHATADHPWSRPASQLSGTQPARRARCERGERNVRHSANQSLRSSRSGPPPTARAVSFNSRMGQDVPLS
ncbi:unnamed protein product, partial [Nesidiocoris tenuis]